MIDQIDIELVLTELIRQMYLHHQIGNESLIQKYLEWKIGLSPITFNRRELQGMAAIAGENLKQHLETHSESPDKRLAELKRIALTKIADDLEFLLLISF